MKGKGKGKSNSPAQNANRAKAATTPSPPFIPRAKCRTMFHNTSDNSATTNKPGLLTNQYKIKATNFGKWKMENGQDMTCFLLQTFVWGIQP